MTVVETAPAKVNLVLRVGPPRSDGMHPLCSLFAALELADEVRVEPLGEAQAGGAAAGGPAAGGGADVIVCRGVDGDNLAAAAVAAFRAASPEAELPPLRIEIAKRIPVAAGLAGGSADAAAVLRAANTLAGSPLSAERLRTVAAGLGSDVPSQVEPTHAIVSGVGERVEPVHLPPMTLVLAPQHDGLSTAAVYAELDRLRADAPVKAEFRPHGGRNFAFGADLDPTPLRDLAAADAVTLAAGLANDLEPAALSLRPKLAETIAALLDAGALGARVTGSGPTVFGVFDDRLAAERAAARIGAERAGAPAPPPPIVTGLLA